MKNNDSSKKYISINTEYLFSLESTPERNAYYTYISLLLKKNNNYIKDATVDKICKLTGISDKSWFKYQKILLKLNLIQKVKGKKDLVILKQKKELHKHYTTFFLYRSLKVEHIEKIFTLDLLNRDIYRQNYTIVLKDVVQETPRINLSIQHKTKLIKKAKKNNLSGEVNYQTYTSYRGLVEKSGFSLGKTHSILKELEKDKKLEKKTALRLIKSNSSYEEYLYLHDMYQKYYGKYVKLIFNSLNKNIYIVIGTTIKLLNIYKYIIINKSENIINNILKRNNNFNKLNKDILIYR